MNKDTSEHIQIPSIEFCISGFLSEGEEYNREIHDFGRTPYERARNFYSKEVISKMEDAAIARGILWRITLILNFFLEGGDTKEEMTFFNQSDTQHLEKAILENRKLDYETHSVEIYFNNSKIDEFKTFQELGITSGSEIHVCVKKNQGNKQARNGGWIQYLSEGLNCYFQIMEG
jgi:hypothetical protein